MSATNQENNRRASLSAEMVAHWRASHIPISRDVYAHLFPSSESILTANEFKDSIYPNVDIEICLRNRHAEDCFLDSVSKLGIRQFINIAAGFNTTPIRYLTSTPVTFFEVDLPVMSRIKIDTLKKLTEEGQIPDVTSEIHFVEANVNSPVEMMEEIYRAGYKHEEPSFFLIEGLSYYITKGTFIKLIEIIHSNTRCHKAIYFDYFSTEIKDREEYYKMEKILKEGGEPVISSFSPKEIKAIFKSCDEYSDFKASELERLYCSEPFIINDNIGVPARYVFVVNYGTAPKNEI